MNERTLDVRSHEVTHAIPSPYIFFGITAVYLSHVYAFTGQPGPDVKATAVLVYSFHPPVITNTKTISFGFPNVVALHQFVSGPN